MVDRYTILNQPAEITKGVIPEGMRPYHLANIALTKMMIARNESYTTSHAVKTARDALAAIVRADEAEEFDPPLPPELSRAVSMMHEYGESAGAFRDQQSSLSDCIDTIAFGEAALLVSAVSQYGLSRGGSQV